jgi:hypothetical protein
MKKGIGKVSVLRLQNRIDNMKRVIFIADNG